MGLFDGQVTEHGDFIELEGNALNEIVVTKIEGGVGMAIAVPHSPGDMDNEDFPEDMMMLLLEVTTADGTMHRLGFRDDAVKALNEMVGDYIKVQVHDMLKSGDMPAEARMIMEMLKRLEDGIGDAD